MLPISQGPGWGRLLRRRKPGRALWWGGDRQGLKALAGGGSFVAESLGGLCGEMVIARASRPWLGAAPSALKALAGFAVDFQRPPGPPERSEVQSPGFQPRAIGRSEQAFYQNATLHVCCIPCILIQPAQRAMAPSRG